MSAGLCEGVKYIIPLPRLVAGDDLYDFYGRSLGRIHHVKSSIAVNMTAVAPKYPTNAIITEISIMRDEL